MRSVIALRRRSTKIGRADGRPQGPLCYIHNIIMLYIQHMYARFKPNRYLYIVAKVDARGAGGRGARLLLRVKPIPQGEIYIGLTQVCTYTYIYLWVCIYI